MSLTTGTSSAVDVGRKKTKTIVQEDGDKTAPQMPGSPEASRVSNPILQNIWQMMQTMQGDLQDDRKETKSWRASVAVEFKEIKSWRASVDKKVTFLTDKVLDLTATEDKTHGDKIVNWRFKQLEIWQQVLDLYLKHAAGLNENWHQYLARLQRKTESAIKPGREALDACLKKLGEDPCNSKDATKSHKENFKNLWLEESRTWLEDMAQFMEREFCKKQAPYDDYATPPKRVCLASKSH